MIKNDEEQKRKIHLRRDKIFRINALAQQEDINYNQEIIINTYDKELREKLA